MSCERPLDDSVLGDYWLAALPEPQEHEIEDHLFQCDDCGARMASLIALGAGLKALGREGSLHMVVSEEFLRCSAEAGLRIREYAPPPGGSVACTVTADDDLLIGRLHADLTGVERLDLCFYSENGAEMARLLDIPFDRGSDSVLFEQSITYAKGAPSETVVARLIAIDDTGQDRVLNEYTFKHTRSLPGPGERRLF
jgi:hypothetical protein